MPPSDLSESDQTLLDRVKQSTLRMLDRLWEVSEAYLRIDPAGRALGHGEAAEVRELAERLAVPWREAEQSDATAPTIERELGSKRTHDLVWALLDSLVLALAATPDRRRLALRFDDVIAQVKELADLYEVPPHERHRHEPLDDKELTPTDALAFERLDAQAEDLLGEASSFYVALSKTGGEVRGAGAVEANDLLERLAMLGLQFNDRHRLVASFAHRRDLAPIVQLARSMQNGLLLRLSGDEGRRALAIPTEELGSRIKPVYEAMLREAEGA